MCEVAHRSSQQIMQIALAWATAPGTGQWQPMAKLFFVNSAIKDEFIKSVQEMKFRQLSTMGYIHCRMMITVGVCDLCGHQWVQPGTDQILDEAFKRECDKAVNR